MQDDGAQELAKTVREKVGSAAELRLLGGQMIPRYDEIDDAWYYGSGTREPLRVAKEQAMGTGGCGCQRSTSGDGQTGCGRQRLAREVVLPRAKSPRRPHPGARRAGREHTTGQLQARRSHRKNKW